MEIVPTIPMAATPWRSGPACHPSLTMERSAASTYVIGLRSLTVASQPLSAALGTKAVVRKRRGKKRMKLDATAAALPVRKAMA